jgi:hypothetical protein
MYSQTTIYNQNAGSYYHKKWVRNQRKPKRFHLPDEQLELLRVRP